ncbi:methyl-accepting chemotaxis protein [Phaeobacter gallaeciensis]|uniref:methyl-accepting chemotaxis protein n=1 Tax=Phaeobacter gallaeciensis TaxID=60890 RepID=UPI000BBB7D23|nr:PAS domain-containing methyl-accepting chemotaxis protein [Phaeobacter gallaeciensis]ATF18767.1 chemoreceptor McpA [Phaeobacter gallaeciensis]ATF22876.1 chemoreceptor McpA [Phaeobacter gallaeciensis]
MFFKRDAKKQQAESTMERSIMDMIDRTQAMIQFEPDGTILEANANFLGAVGYALNEIQGNHHSMFVDPEYASSAEYKAFWQDLASGKFFTDQFPRVTKAGQTIWIQATYAPVLDSEGQTVRVIKLATDITARQNSVADISSGLEALSKGDLSYRVQPCELPDMQVLCEAFNNAQDTLNGAVETVKVVAEAVGSTASEISQSSSELSHRTETQAATLEETAAAIEQLTSTVRSAADGAREVENIVSNARTTAEESGEVVSSAVTAMSQIEESSGKISQIISVIDDIAFQTNLLALNAGVEAARAGEAGRGFAVVASEVRALAQRSSDAAGEIKQLINESSQYVGNGVKLVSRAGEELQKIIGSVSTISGHVSQIATGAAEQSVTLVEINTGVSQLDQVTQHNAAMVEEATAASQTLSNDANELTRQISIFKTRSGTQNIVSFGSGGTEAQGYVVRATG